MENLFEFSRLSQEIELFLVVTLLSFIPVIVVAFTTFTRNIIVLSFLRHALGLPQSPPNLVLIILALFITTFTMRPVFDLSYEEGLKPYMNDELAPAEAGEKMWAPFKRFMIVQTNEKDIEFMYGMANEDRPETADDVKWNLLVPAFLLSELSVAFKIGFIIFLPFLLIDLVMAAILTSLGMIMVPPITISLPLKVMLFVTIDGWRLITEVLLKSVSG